jgi:GH43 family beta-xylosidase
VNIARPRLTTTLEPEIRPTIEFDLPVCSDWAEEKRETFVNPIIPPASADPWVIAFKGAYYYCESRSQNSIWIRKAECFTELGADEGVQVWVAPTLGPNSNAVWAPELHQIGERWYIYYAADDGLNENHRMWVLESVTNDPQGAYRCKGMLETQGWAIDGTILKHEGELYFVWSGWPGALNGKQNLYMAPMSNPWTIAGDRVLLATPDLRWERIEMDICEGPQVLQRHGKLFIVYSASGSWTPDYCLGMLEFTGGNVSDPQCWKKWDAPVFRRNSRVWGVGHCSFVQSPDGLEDWIVYHAKTRKKSGWNDRNVHAQRFTWTEDGNPFFGAPIAAGEEVALPSGRFAALADI